MPFLYEHNGQIYYESYGSGPPLVLIHGFGGNCESWFRQIPFLSKEFKLITYDCRGAGKSIFSTDESSVEIFAMDLCKLVDHINLQKFFLLGFSMGGRIALRFTLANKNRVKALILANTSSEINERMKGRYIKMARLGKEKGMEAVAKKMTCAAFSENFQKENQELTRAFKQVNSKRSLRGFINICQAQASFSSITDLLQGIEIPTLIITGNKDEVVSHKLAKLLHKNIRNSEIVTIQDAGHSTYLEQPERFNTSVMNFLRKVAF